MEAVIPNDVLKHLQQLTNGERNPFAGGFTVAQVVAHFGISADQARELVRQLLREGRIYSRRQGVSQEIANRMGYLNGCSVPVYYFTKEA